MDEVAMEKRQVHPVIKALLRVDSDLTDQFCLKCEQFMSFRSLKVHYKLLEISCHGILWLAGWLAFIWMANSPSLYEMQVNLYLGLLLDIIIVGVTKAVFRRRRPKANNPDMFVTVGPDVYSFPSGHATRATFIATFFIYLVPLPLPVQLPLIAWATAVSVSRVLLRRHHILDVLAGVAVGFFETLLIGIIWLGPGVSAYLVSSLSEYEPNEFVDNSL